MRRTIAACWLRCLRERGPALTPLTDPWRTAGTPWHRRFHFRDAAIRRRSFVQPRSGEGTAGVSDHQGSGRLSLEHSLFAPHDSCIGEYESPTPSVGESLAIGERRVRTVDFSDWLDALLVIGRVHNGSSKEKDKREYNRDVCYYLHTTVGSSRGEGGVAAGTEVVCKAFTGLVRASRLGGGTRWSTAQVEGSPGGESEDARPGPTQDGGVSARSHRWSGRSGDDARRNCCKRLAPAVPSTITVGDVQGTGRRCPGAATDASKVAHEREP